jgi:RHS repeat-associated protein
MIRNFTFLLYLGFLLLAIALPANQRREGKVKVYVVEPTTIAKETVTKEVPATGPTIDIIAMPDLPAAEVYTPNSIKDFKTGNPAEGITLIDAPVPNASGNAVFQFNMKLPEGRADMVPDVSIVYNNESGNGWMGYGWAINMPGVGIETRWGSPRYDPALETEMYTLNGELLAPMNNRSELLARSAEKRFYKRVEGSFSRIIRHGNNPSNYWWEVTEKDGTRSFYGGRPGTGIINNAVLRDDLNNIAYWALVETREVGDNFVRYEYVTVDDPGITGGTVPGKQIYPGRIYYTGLGTTDGPYSIEFIRDRELGEARRSDVTIDARFGFKMVNADLLRRVNISLNGQLIRRYEYTYTTGAFYKTLLASISEIDDAGEIFYTHHFDYFDDVNKNNYDPATGATGWEVANDGIQGDIINPIEGFTGEANVIGASKASSISGGAAVTVGSWSGGLWSKNSSVGGGFSYGEDNQEGLTSLIDINGDGLPDKVYKKDGRLHYRPNLGIANRAFGEDRPILNISDFSTSNSKNIGGGAQVVPPQGFIGYNHTTTTTTSKIYFTDFNGDGLVDIASDGRVFFNRLNSNRDPDFTLNSGETPSPIFTGSIDASFFAPDTALQRRQELNFPLQDIVRVWQAPFSGTVNITAPVQLMDIPSTTGVANPKKDGVRASIQIGPNVIDNVVIPAGDFTVKNFMLNGRTVTKGQNIYFRVQSRYNGHDDLVNWDPVIQYTTPTTQSSDVQHKTSNYYRASEDFILSSKGSAGMGKNGDIKVLGTFEKQTTSDTVYLRIVRDRDSVLTTIYQRDYAPQELANDSLNLPGNIPVLNGDQLYFQVVSRSYIDRSALLWKPYYKYVGFTFPDSTPVTNRNGVPTIQGYPIPDNSNFNSWVTSVPPATVSRQDTVILKPRLTGNAAATGSLWFTIKGIDTVYARQRVFMLFGTMLPVDSLTFIRRVGLPLFFEFATDSMQLAQALDTPRVVMYRDSIFTDTSGLDTVRLNYSIPANLYANPSQYYLGPLFRGWGQFALRGDKGDIAIPEDSLNLDQMEDYPSDPADFADTSSLGNIPDPSKSFFVPLFPNGIKDLWVGYDTSTYVTASTMRSARLWMYDVSVDSLMAGESAGAVHKISITETDSYSAGLSTVSASAGYSTATTTLKLDMMDMNGDRYPDVLNNDMIQYTLPNGGLGTAVIWQPVGATESYGSSAGIGLGGDFLEASTENTTKKGASAANKQARASAGLSGNVNFNQDENLSSWIDINGDGLTDRVYKSGIVQLNLGYRFADGENWGLEAIDMADSYSYGAGAGVNIDGGSFDAGFGLSRTEGDNTFGLNDVNGDGLPDQMRINLDSRAVTVRLNNGTGFGPYLGWNFYDGIVRNISTGESINGAFSVVIPIPIPFFPIKIVINPSFAAGQGVSRQEKAVMDLDGDGFADMLDSDNDGDLSATTSTIGRTNMLKSVRGPLGGYFAVNYSRIGNTYDLPQSKWVMSALEVFDGVPGDGVDTMRQRFEYDGGLQERHEREFYGFRRVITRDLNTANNNIVYRSRVQEFSNSNYYTKGLLGSEWVEDADGNKYTQTINEYAVDSLQNFVQWPKLSKVTKLFFEGRPTAGVSTYTQYEYDDFGNITMMYDAGDGLPQDWLRTDITYHDLNALYKKDVPASIEVTTVDGIKRRQTTSINQKGGITKWRQYLADGTYADTDFTFDVYGNVTSVTRPANYRNQRMFHNYEYDDVIHKYITRVTDAFGYTSTSTWDYRFGALTGSVSINEEPTNYTIDNRGRLTAVTGPYEIAAGKPYTIAYEYHPADAVPNAVTRHYDPEHDADIILVNFADGLGRVVQDKKQVSLFKGKNAEDELKMVVSGTTLFDAFGRTDAEYYQVTEPMGTPAILNGATGKPLSTISFDIMDRVTKRTLADGTETNVEYSITDQLFSAVTTDAMGNVKETQSDVRGRKRFFKETGPDGVITTRYDYNALSELYKVTDNAGNAFTAAYDNFGRKTNSNHPDAGHTDFEYDLSGNLLKKITGQIKKEIPNGGAIRFQYDFDRLTDIDYPRNYQNKVTLKYGAAGTGRKTGRLILQQDASGGQEFFYGLQGEVVKTIRTVLVSQLLAVTYVSEQEFDTWNRLKKVTYADGEAVTYHYNRGGKLSSMDGVKQGHTYKYVDQAGYDEFEQRVYLRYGNGAETKYAYDDKRRLLTLLQVNTPGGQALVNSAYTYDAVGNVLGIVNGEIRHDYHYDNLYRIDSASGAGRAGSYGLKLSYDNLFNISQKRASGSLSYDYNYGYDASRPHHVATISERTYKYDENGNQLGYGDIENFFDEENRLVGVINKGVLSQFTYDADGERVIKSSGGMQGVWLNGAPAGQVKHTDNYTIDVNPFISCRAATFTKHYYIEGERIASKLGHGKFTNINFPKPVLTAGGIDYNKRAALMEKARQEYYASLGVSPGPPTDKNFWARPENSGIPAPVYIDTGATSVPPGWPGNTTPPPDGPPVFVDSIPSNDSVKAGFGFRDPGQLYEVSQFFYHPDHLQSTNFMTHVQGEMSLHVEYSAFGEIFAKEQVGSFSSVYLYQSKSFDEETGYIFYGSRYYDPSLSLWLSVADPFGDEYPNERAGGYLNTAGLMNNAQGNSALVTAGGAGGSSAMLGSSAGGAPLSAYETGDDGGGGGDGKGDRPNKGGNKSAGSKGNVGKGNHGAYSGAKEAGSNNPHKRGFRQGRNGLKAGGMFYSHNKQQKSKGNKISQIKQPVKTRPRR